MDAAPVRPLGHAQAGHGLGTVGNLHDCIAVDVILHPMSMRRLIALALRLRYRNDGATGQRCGIVADGNGLSVAQPQGQFAVKAAAGIRLVLPAAGKEARQYVKRPGNGALALVFPVGAWLWGGARVRIWGSRRRRLRAGSLTGISGGFTGICALTWVRALTGVWVLFRPSGGKHLRDASTGNGQRAAVHRGPILPGNHIGQGAAVSAKVKFKSKQLPCATALHFFAYGQRPVRHLVGVNVGKCHSGGVVIVVCSVRRLISGRSHMQRFVVVCQRHVHRHRVYGPVVLHPRDIGIRLLNGIDIFACLGKGDVAKARAAFPGNRDLGRIRKRRFDGLTVRARPYSSDGELYLAIVVLQAFALSVILAHLESSAAVQHSAGGGIGIFKDDCLRISGVFPVYPALNLLRLFQRHSSNFKGGLSSPAALRHRNGQLVHRLVIGHSGDRTSWNGFFDEIGIGSRLRKGDGSELACMFRRIVSNGNRRTAAARLSSLGHGWGNTFIIWNPSHRKGKSVVG